MLAFLEGVGREVQVHLGLARPRGAPEELRKLRVFLRFERIKRCLLGRA